MSDDGFDRIAPPSDGGRRRRADGRAVLFSDEPLAAANGRGATAQTGRAGRVSSAGHDGAPRFGGAVLRCPRCEAVTPVSPLALLCAALPLPLPTLALTPGRADLLAVCEGCGRRNWLRVGW
ncbi:MAG: hypothetical protein ACR2MA_02520 [Egibacteraceae bacterium]